MEIRTLRYFLEAAREENMSKAAERMHISQSALSIKRAGGGAGQKAVCAAQLFHRADGRRDASAQTRGRFAFDGG